MNDSDSEHTPPPEEDFISRWSRRKQVARSGSADTQVQSLAVDEFDGEPVNEAYDDSHDEMARIPAVEDDYPDDSDMPALETLDEESDYSGFMSPKVSEGLRTLALRQLFRGSMFSVRDGLDDYDDDFTRFTKLGDVVTAEMRRQMERLKQAGEDDQDEVIATEEDPSSEEDSELAVNAESPDAAGTALERLVSENEQKAENEKFTGKDDSGEKLHVSTS